MTPLEKNNKVQQKSQTKNEDNYLTLFGDMNIQKEVVAILEKYLDLTKAYLKGNNKEGNLNASLISFGGNSKNLIFEAQESLHTTRLYSALLVIFLAKSKKEQLRGLHSLMVDLNVENITIVESMRELLIENNGLNLILWVMKTFESNFEVLQEATDILLCLNYNGTHYRSFIDTISKEENIEVRQLLNSKLISIIIDVILRTQ